MKGTVGDTWLLGTGPWLLSFALSSPWFQFVATLVRNPALLCVDVSLMFSWSDPNFRKSESRNVWDGQQHSLCLLFKVPEC